MGVKYLFPSFLGFHLNFLTMASMSVHSFLGNSKKDTLQIRVAWATDLIMVALPIHDKHFHFQPLTQPSSLSLIKERSLFLVANKNIGSPKYFTFFGS